MSYEVVLVPEAQRELEQIHDWIAQRSPDGAAHWFNRFTEMLLTLETQPANYGLAA
jgi:hypothetical protein